MRVRILAVVIVLLLASSVGSVLLLRAVLLQQLDEEVADSLEREAEEFRLLSQGNDPRTGQPFDGDLPAIFDVYFSRDIPDEGETLLAFVDGAVYESRRAQDAADAEDLDSAAVYWLSLTTNGARSTRRWARRGTWRCRSRAAARTACSWWATSRRSSAARSKRRWGPRSPSP